MENEKVLKLTNKIAEEMSEKFASADFQEIIKSLKAVKDTGTFEMVISTDDIDRHGEIVDQKGIDFTNYMKNPVVLWGHNHNQIPVGITDEIYTRVVGNQVQTVAKGRFAEHEFAQTLRQLYDAGMIKTSSIGFIPFEYNGNVITKSELLEWSFVSIPANPYALALGKSGFNLAELTEKGIVIENIKHGDEVETPEEVATVETPVETVETPAEEIAPVVEEPVVETTEPVQEEKGAIADEISEEETRRLKYENFEKISRLFYAFGDVYFDEETPVEDFETLKSEFISLLNGEVPNSRLTTTSGKSIDEIKEKIFAEQKAGRVISSANREKISNAISALEEVLTIADASEEKTIDAVETDGVQEKETGVEAIEDYLTLRKNVQNISGLFQNMLKDAKVTASKYGKTRSAN